MHKKTGIAIVAVGVALILSALLLFLHNCREDSLAGQEAESLMKNVEAMIDMKKVTSDSLPNLDPQMPVIEIDGYEYVGYIEIPSLELKLPVMSEWDYDRLKIAPCRQVGSSRTDDLVIAAHNYESHFGRLKDLSVGECVIFTDMQGIVNTYSVEEIKTLNPDEVEAVLNSEYDLVLYTCTKGGKTRVSVFCNRVV